MKTKIASLLQEIEHFNAKNGQEVEDFRIKLLSRKGLISELFEEFKTVPPDLKRELGQHLNLLRNKAQDKLNELKDKFETSSEGTKADTDLSLPGDPFILGSRHPLSIVRNEIIAAFNHIGFTIADGPEIEDDWHNFSALNFPENHPARDMQDTFFVDAKSGDKGAYALRTHTSSVQVRIMESTTPPIRMIFPGRVYRNEAISARAHCFFHQIEGLYIDKNVSFADLKQTLVYFAKQLFGEDTKIRLRPSYFPFTEPSAEMDITCYICSGEGCAVCKHSGWVEILGCGMVDPAVLENCKIDTKQYSGFAFGMGIERITLLKYKVNDLRLFSENYVRFLNQFKSAGI